MKVLFAVSNENISTQIVKKYRKDYKEIIQYKNMYYFNAIVKELQRDKSYDRIVISEDLEPFANNNNDAIDKFLFEKLDNISDEATGVNGEDIPIILLSTDRRSKSEPILVKLFGIGIYNALLGQDRSTTNVCTLLNKPRSKKEAKIYYKIESEEVSYKTESEENVSEAEIQNILNHYKRLGKDETRYIESFNNIAAQYNDAQLRIITKFLPIGVKAVLEEKSPKYQSVMTFGDTSSTINAMKRQKEANGLKIGFLENGTSEKPSRPVIVPTAVKKVAVKKATNTTSNVVRKTENIQVPQTIIEEKKVVIEDTLPGLEEIENTLPGIEEIVTPQLEKVEKRGRGRPKKVKVEEVNEVTTEKRGRGRPKKVVQEINEENILPGFDDFEEEKESTSINNSNESGVTLPGFDDLDDFEDEEIIIKDEQNTSNTMVLPGFDDDDEKIEINNTKVNEDVLPGFDIPESNIQEKPIFEKTASEKPVFEKLKLENISNNNYNTANNSNYNSNNNNYANNKPMQSYDMAKTNYSGAKISGLISKDRKIVSFVGTTKNGTSFLVNNVAKCLSTMGIKTAILDLTSNRNSYYIYTKNEEKLRNIAFESIKKLRSGITSGIAVDKYLDVYTALPDDTVPLEDIDGIISTLVQNYSVVLMDCDFNTPADYFDVAQELYVVQTMDILTIQPMTAFLRDLKAKDILKPEKIRIVLNKEIKVRGLTAKAIIGGIAFYNDPAMAFMTELFNKETVKYCMIPFENEVYSKYLEGVMDCQITISGYSKNFNMKLKELTSMVYPLIDNKYKAVGDYSSNYKFSSSMNNTLEQMKNKY